MCLSTLLSVFQKVNDLFKKNKDLSDCDVGAMGDLSDQYGEKDNAQIQWFFIHFCLLLKVKLAHRMPSYKSLLRDLASRPIPCAHHHRHSTKVMLLVPNARQLQVSSNALLDRQGDHGS